METTESNEKKEGFLILTKEFTDDYLLKLRPESVHLYIYLAKFINKGKPAIERFCWPGMNKMLEDLEEIKSKNTILKAINELFEIGLIHAIIPIRDVKSEDGNNMRIIKGFQKAKNCPNAYYINLLDDKDKKFIGTTDWDELNSMTRQIRQQKSEFFKNLASKRKNNEE